MKIPPFSLEIQTQALKKDLMKAFERVMDSGQYVLGQEVTAFETNVAQTLDVSHAIGVSSGTDALWLALKALEVGPGDQVLTTPFTFFATASAILKTGATPVFADIDPKTFNLNPESVQEVLKKNKRMKAMIPVHLYGQSASMNELLSIAKENNLHVVEDAAQAFGAKYQGKQVGGLGDFGCFSFFPTKNLGAFGDGGLVTTNNQDLADRLRLLRVHGSQKKYVHEFVGGNGRLDALQAALLSVKLKHVQKWIEARQKIANQYDQLLEDVDLVQIPTRDPKGEHSFHQYTLRIGDGNRDALMEHLKSKEIGSSVYYPIPLHLQPSLQALGYSQGDFPEAEKASQEVLSLPMYPELTEEQVKEVVQVIGEFMASGARKDSV